MIDTPARRGRTASCPDAAAGPVAAFAHRLWELKRRAGDPSYDRMRGEYGALASKSALSAAARGRRLPSWDTTWEFVRALAVGVLGEPEDEVRAHWRAAWERARTSVAEQAATAEPMPPAPAAASTGTAPRRSWRRAPVAAVVATTALLAAGTVVGIEVLRPSAGEPDTGVPAPPPLIAGDASEFGGDVTVPDGTEIPTGTRFVKTWEFRNAGTVPWIGRYLRREGSFGDGRARGECLTPERVPIARTMPGESVRVSVEVRAPEEPGYCQVYWKMVDAKGRLLLPGQRAAYFFVRVVT